MNQNKLVSIMIPTYNAQATIKDTLVSILAQTYKNLEIIVVDNASTDNTVSIVRQFDDPRLKIIVNPVNLGAEGNFNKCIELATGDYIALYHADDVYEPTIVEEEVDFMEKYPEAGGVGTMATIIDENNQKIGELNIPKKLFNNSSIYHLKEILSTLLEYGNSFLVCPTAMLRKDIYKNEIQRYRFDLFKSAADGDVWLRVLEKHSIGIIPKKLINYRRSTEHFSYNYHKLRTDKDHGLIVFEYYYDKYKDILNEQDRKNLKFYNFKDNIFRALNHSIQKHPDEAKKLLNSIFDKEIMQRGIKNLKNAKIYMAGFVLYISIYIGLSYITAKVIKRIK